MVSMDTNELLISDQVSVILRTVPRLRLAFLYGSAVTGGMRADSDVDIAVLFDQALSVEGKMELVEQLEACLLRTVDLVDLFATSGTILRQILCAGRVLVKTDANDLFRLTQRMIYNQADMMPYVRRTLIERQEKFIYG